MKKLAGWALCAALGFAAAIGLIFFKTDIGAKSAIALEIAGKGQEPTVYKNAIDKEAVVEALKQKAQIVGMEGEVKKEYMYQDKIYDSKTEFIQSWGERKYALTLKGTFKLGADIGKIRAESVSVSGNSVKIFMPKIELVSFEAPYDKAEVSKEVGVLRRDFTEEERKTMYKQAREKALEEVLADKASIEEAKKGTREALRQLLSVVPNVETVEFAEN